MALKDQPTLPRAMAARAYIPMVSDNTKNGKPRRILIAKLVDAQERKNPILFTPDRRELISYTGIDAGNRASETAANTLATGQMFNAGYTHFEITISVENGKDRKFRVSAARLNNSSSSDRVLLSVSTSQRYAIWRQNNTSFRMHYSGTETTTDYLKSIHGLKIAFSRSEG